MKCLEGFAHAFGIAEASFSLSMHVVLQNVLTNVGLMQSLSQTQLSAADKTLIKSLTKQNLG